MPRSAAPAPSPVLCSSPARGKSTEGHPLETPLLQAALLAAVQVPRRAECLAAIRAALEAGADVNARDHWGLTPLRAAIGFNHDAAAVTAAVEALVTAGADVRAKAAWGAEPLHMSGSNRCGQALAAAVHALLAAGADALATDNAGRTPLH